MPLLGLLSAVFRGAPPRALEPLDAEPAFRALEPPCKRTLEELIPPRVALRLRSRQALLHSCIATRFGAGEAPPALPAGPPRACGPRLSALRCEGCVALCALANSRRAEAPGRCCAGPGCFILDARARRSTPGPAMSGEAAWRDATLWLLLRAGGAFWPLLHAGVDASVEGLWGLDARRNRGATLGMEMDVALAVTASGLEPLWLLLHAWPACHARTGFWYTAGPARWREPSTSIGPAKHSRGPGPNG